MSKSFGKRSEYPLQWPAGFPRTKSRKQGKFSTTLHKALTNVVKSLELLSKDSGKKIDAISITSNVTLGEMKPTDPGICIYFEWDGIQLCVPVDRYDKVEHNLQAIYHIIESDRVKIRHGGFEYVMAEKKGRTNLLLESPEDREWYNVLGVSEDAQKTEIVKAYKALVLLLHPDKKTGNEKSFKELQKAYRKAMRLFDA